MNEPARIVTPPRSTAEGDAFDWSHAEISTLARTTDDDIADARSWLKRLGLSQALDAFDN